MSGVQVPPPLFIFMKYIYPLFLKNIQKNNLIESKDTIIVAFSGGKDSVTLTLLLKKLKEDLNIKLKAAYFNHRIREDAEAEQRWVENFCVSNKIELIVESKDIIDFKEEKKLNLENAASLSRYEFLERTSKRFKNSKISTAHTGSDLTETFLMKLFRGSGFRGLSSIYTQKGRMIIRPLLIFTEDDILSFLDRNKIKYYKDYTNDQNEFLRNRIRNILMPEIKKIEPNINKHIFKTVLLVQDEYEYLSESAKRFLKKKLILSSVLPLKNFKDLHIALKRNVLREYIRILKGDLLNIDFEHIESILKDYSKTDGISIPGLTLKFQKDFIYPSDFFIPEYSYEVKSKGKLRIKEINGEIEIKTDTVYKKPVNNFEIIAHSSKVEFPLIIRNPKKDDKYMKLNSSFIQKIFEMIRISGIPPEMRNLCPVLINGDGNPVWVAGSPVSESLKVTEKKEKSFIRISYKKHVMFD